MAHTESDRIAFNQHQAAQAQTAKINNWLAANPSVGVLNGGEYYIIENSMTKMVAPLSKIV